MRLTPSCRLTALFVAIALAASGLVRAAEPIQIGTRVEPFVDDFLPARSLTNLADLALHLNALARSRVRRQ